MKLFPAILFSIGVLAAAPPAPDSRAWRTGPLANVKVDWPEARPASVVVAPLYPKPMRMKLLLLSGDGTEGSLRALKSGLDYIGVPYDSIVASQAPLPKLAEGGKGLYQGVILATGSLAYQADGVWKSALSTEAWAQLDAYCRDYQVRTVSYYTFPEARYGMQLVSASSEAGVAVEFAPGAADAFPYLNRTNALPLSGAYLYQAKPVQGPGEVTTPVLTVNGLVSGVVHGKPDGRQTLALTMDHNPSLRHSMAMVYGVVNWVSKGVFLGEQRAYLTPQNDDLFLANRLFVFTIDACRPSEFVVDQSVPELAVCPALRVSGADIRGLREWQAKWNAIEQMRDFRVTMAYNGFGTVPKPGAAADDSLVAESIAGKDDFFWLSHTYDHKNLDCMGRDGAGRCRGVNADEALFELAENFKSADALGLPVDRLSMVTPGLSGLRIDAFLATAAAQGIRYLVSDASRPEWLPAAPNTAVRVDTAPPIHIVPRHATSLFFHTASGYAAVDGSEPDAYNFLYGPNGVNRLGGVQDGQPFFAEEQSYDAILNRESDTLLSYMLRGDFYPLMFHQANFWRYDGQHSLYSDLMDRTLEKFMRISAMPVLSLPQSEIGRRAEERLAYLASGVQATLEAGGTIAFEATAATVVPVTGICPGECESYGGQRIARVAVDAGRTVRVQLEK